MGQVENLTKNVKKLTQTIYDLKKKSFLSPPIPQIDIASIAMTPRQIAKKVILVSCGSISAAGEITQNTANASINAAGALGDPNAVKASEAINSPEALSAFTGARMLKSVVTPESAHLIVYGKLMRDANGKLVDNEVLHPECVFDGLAMPKTHPTLQDVQKYVMLADRAVKMIGIKNQDLLDDIAQAMISIPANITAMVSAAALMPPGAGIPVAFAAFQNLIQVIMGLTMKITELLGVLPDLEYIPLVLPKEQIDVVLIPVNVILSALITIMSTINGVTSMIPSSSAMSTMAGGASLPPAAYVGGTVTGTVVRANTNTPVPNATVKIGSQPSVQTDIAGKFSVEKVQTGDQTININHINYIDYNDTVKVQNDQTTNIDVYLLSI
jgi:hypothetical protein